MGHIFERFGNLSFYNEDEVSNNFVIPLFKEFLGYRETEILPQHLQPTIKIPRNRKMEVNGDDAKIKPDFMVALNGNKQQIVFSFESKGPRESLDDYLQQLIAYCISVRRNLVGTTNGSEFRVYDANILVFKAIDIASLDLQYFELKKLLHRDVAHIPLAERIRSLNDDIALGRSAFTIENEKRKQIAVRNSEFESYLETVINSLDALTLPPAIADAFQIELKRFPAQELYTFLPPRTELDLNSSEPCTYNQIISDIRNSSILIVGESGIGKTSLLAQIAHEYAESCLRRDSDLIPVLVKLGQYTSANNLRMLILNRLTVGGANIIASEVTDLLRKKRLILLLDAFDEVIDTYLNDLQKEIEGFLHDFECTIVMTTRHFRLPQVSLISKFELQPLTHQKIRSFSEMYLGLGHQGFLNEIIRKDLIDIASNTLLLTLLILLYLNNQDLPSSRTKLIEAVVNQLENWSRSKPTRFHHSLSWQIKLNMLSELAFLSFTKGDSYTLGIEDANLTIIKILGGLEASRKVPQGMQITDAYEQLADTGLICILNSSVSFWHRAFQEYLASLQIAEMVQSGEIHIGSVIKVPKWVWVLPSVTYQVHSPEALISEMLSYNVFTAGMAIVECNLRSGEVYEKTVECLKQRCMSKQRAIRQLAISILRQIEGEFVGSKFYELLESESLKDNNEFEHIRKIALVEIAKRKMPKAHDIIYAHLNWRSSTSFDWIFEESHAGATVIEALGWFDDEESQEHIVDRWMRSIDFPTRVACRDALVKVAQRGTFAISVKQTLFELITIDNSQADRPPNVVPKTDDRKVDVDLFGIASVLIAVHDKQLAHRLVQILGTNDFSYLQVDCIKQILATFNEPEIIEALIQQANNYKNDPTKCAFFLDILSESKGQVPQDIFWGFAQEELPTAAKAYAIRGLGRFSYESIENIVLAGINPPSFQRLIEITNKYLIRRILQIYKNDELIQIFIYFAGLPDILDSAREYLQKLLGRVNNASELMNEFMKLNESKDIKWSIIKNSQSLPSKLLQEAILHLLSPLPYEYMLISNPCDYDRVQEEVFRVLEKHGKISVLTKAEYRSIILYNSSSETLFNIIRRDKVYEAEQLILSIIDRQSNIRHSLESSRMIVEAAWVLADLKNINKAQNIIDQIINDIDLSAHGSDWILGDILKGIHLLPPDYALVQIEKLWPNTKASDLILIRQYCIEALERIGTRRAIDFLARIVQEATNQSEYTLDSERALRAILHISPLGQEDWLIGFLQKEPQDKSAVQRAIEILGVVGSLKALPVITRYFENHPNERIRYFAFWAIHNIYKNQNKVWFNSEEAGCV